jgi:hypothetical protein
VAAGIIVRLAQRGGCRVLLPGDHTPATVSDGAASWRRVHRRLALLAPSGPATPWGPLQHGQAPVAWIRAARAPDEMPGAPPRPLPPGVVAVASQRRVAL